MDLETFRGKLSLFLIGTIVLSLAWIGGHYYRDYLMQRALEVEGEEVVLEPAVAQSATNLSADAGAGIRCHGNTREARQEPWFGELCQRIALAIQRHPSIDINTGLYQRVMSERVFITLEDHRANEIAGTAIRASHAGTDDIVMNFSPTVFRDRQALRDDLLTTVLVHEYRHVQQIEEATEFREDFRMDHQPTTEAAVLRRFGYEVEAYETQCRFSHVSNIRPTNHCVAFDNGDRRGLVTFLIAGLIEQGDELAGHRVAVMRQYAPWMLADASVH